MSDVTDPKALLTPCCPEDIFKSDFQFLRTRQQRDHFSLLSFSGVFQCSYALRKCGICRVTSDAKPTVPTGANAADVGAGLVGLCLVFLLKSVIVCILFASNPCSLNVSPQEFCMFVYGGCISHCEWVWRSEEDNVRYCSPG